MCVLCTGYSMIFAKDDKKPLAGLNIHYFKAYENYAAGLGVQAYLYGLPLYLMQDTMEKMTEGRDSRRPGCAPLGVFGHATRLITPQDTFIVTPNNDTLYSSAWINLAKEPYALHIPEIKDRYYSFCLLDNWTNVFSILGSRTRGSNEGNYLIVGPNWKGKVPDMFKKIVAPTDLVWILVRILVSDEQDVTNVIALQKQFGLTPLSIYQKTGTFQVVPAYLNNRYKERDDIPKDLIFFDRLGYYLHDTKPLADEKAMVSWFNDVGITEHGLDLKMVDQAIMLGLASSIDTAHEILDAFIREKGIYVHNWSVCMIPQGYGTQYLLRAAIAYKGLAALPSEEALYLMAEKDVKGERLNGKNHYILHFNKDQLPPVNAFWSLTMYDEKTFNLIENPIKRYSIGDRTPGVNYNDDGSLDVYIRHERPDEQESNWLPSPCHEFYIILRLYNPKKSALDLTWQVPGIERQD